MKKDEKLRVVILRGSNGNFCSGIDINNFALLATNKELLDSLLVHTEHSNSNKLQYPCTVWRNIPVPVIALLEGSVFGAGLQLALGADIRVASKTAHLSIMELDWGLIPDMGISQALPKLMRYDQALSCGLQGSIIPAPKAESIGLITCVVKNPEKYLHNYIKNLKSRSPEAIAFLKKLFLKAWESDEKTLTLEAEFQKSLIGSSNQLESIASKLGKRDPTFT